MFKARGWTDTFALQYSRTSALGSKVVGIQRWFTNGFQRFLVGILMVYYISIPVPCRWFILLIYWAFNHHLEGLLTIWTIKIGNITGKWWLIHSTKFKVSTRVRGHARVDILGLGAGGVGWDVNVHCDCNDIVRSLALPHIHHATLLHVLLHFHTYIMLRCCTFSCTFTHTSCYAAARSLALPHIRHATLLHILLHFHTYVMLRCCTFSCASTHTSCYAAARSFALPHICHAMLLHGLLHFHTYVMLWARTACCADCCKAWKGASKQQVPEKRHKWQNVAHNRGEFVKHLGRKPKKRVLLWPEHRL